MIVAVSERVNKGLWPLMRVSGRRFVYGSVHALGLYGVCLNRCVHDTGRCRRIDVCTWSQTLACAQVQILIFLCSGKYVLLCCQPVFCVNVHICAYNLEPRAHYCSLRTPGPVPH